MAKKKIILRRRKKTDRRKSVRTVHVIDDHSSPRDVALARVDLVSFFTKRL